MDIDAEILSAGHKIHPVARMFPPMEDGEFAALCMDIREHGLLEPIVRCEYEGETVILDGRHRFIACLESGMAFDDIKFVDYEGDTPVAFVVSKNKTRRHLKPSQLAMIAAGIKPLYEKEAKKRQEAHQFKKDNGNAECDSGRTPEKTEEFDGSGQEKGRAVDQAGAVVGVSGRSVSRAEKVIAGGCDELQEAVRNGLIDITLGEKLARLLVREQRQVLKKIKENPDKNSASIFRKYQKDKLVRKVRREPLPPPEGPFRVITVNPSWGYGRPVEDGEQRNGLPYPTMSLTEVIGLVDKIDGFAEDDCILFLWGTGVQLADGTLNAVLDAWEFDGKMVLTWEWDRIRPGEWLHEKTEHCILAVRGKPVIDLTNQSTIIRGAVREQSRRPEEFYRLVEKLCPGSKLEVFAIEEREGWRVWNPEVWDEEVVVQDE